MMHWRLQIALLMAAGVFAQQPLRFEVASVKPSLVESGLIRASKNESGTRITYRTISVRRLILDEAFGANGVPTERTFLAFVRLV